MAPAKKATRSTVKGSAKPSRDEAPNNNAGDGAVVDQGLPESSAPVPRVRSGKTSGSNVEQAPVRGARSSQTKNGKSSGVAKVIVLDDDEESDGFSVSVSRRALKGVPEVGKVKQFGSVDSDELVLASEVHLVARKSRPRSSSLSSLSSAGSEDEGVTGVPSVGPTSEARAASAQVPDTVLVPSVVISSTAEKRRRAAGDDGCGIFGSGRIPTYSVGRRSLSPSKVRVKDLTLSPQKAAKAVSGGVVDLRAGTRRSAAAAKEECGDGDGKSSVLLARLDALSDKLNGEPAGEDGSRTTRRPMARARRGRDNQAKLVSGRSNKAVPDEEVPDSDSSMVSPTVSRVPTPSPKSRGKRRAVELPEADDSDDSLPSPASVLASKTKAPAAAPKSVQEANQAYLGGVSSGHKKGPAKRKEVVPPGSPKWDIEDMDVDDNQDVIGSVHEEKGATQSHPRIGSRKGHKGSAERGEVRAATESRAIAQVSAPEVFSTAISLPEDDDDSDFEAEVEPAREPLLDPERIHPNLLRLYGSLPWIDGLKRAKFIGYSNTEGIFDDFTPVSYARLLDAVEPRVMSKLTRSIGFVQYKDFKSPVRVPLAGFTRNWECVRVPRKEGTRSAAFVLTGVSTASYVAAGREVGQSYVKQLHVRPLENDWLVLQCNIGTFLNDTEMHAPGRNNALVFQTKRQGWVPRSTDRGQDPLGSTPYASPAKPGSSKAQDVDMERLEGDDADVVAVNVLDKGAPPYRTFDEGIPLYDGRTRPGVKGFRFGPDDWESYTSLPVYPQAEVEDQSLVTVVFTLAAFRIGNASCHTVHFNALFAIVLGKVKL
ncbi:hypothetical protein VNI00_011316 [Paramarasmius palmivorus]|uniref:Uncharacterized protein n=1 Tax=Paramarasmius palmivorus TaxID=297713 RepID=A0AAW0CEM4_9AGAR